MNKKYITIFALLLTQVAVCQYEWTWIDGEKSENVGRVYGIQGIPTALNNPGSRIGAAFWRDNQGNLWLFGGRGNSSGGGLLNDLWKYNVATGHWTWMGGGQTLNSSGIYEDEGEPSPGNIPGARQNGVFWLDGNGDFWLFGGRGLPSYKNGDDGDDDDPTRLLNDLWKYSVSTGQWTFVNGSDRQDQSGRYGSRTVPSPSNRPGARYSASGWTDPDGSLWLFGGRGYGSDNDEIVLLDDVWKYSPSQNTWAWMSGDESGDEEASYGEKGNFDNSNTPGGRHGSMSWVDNAGNFWLYGGGTLTNLFADLWRYDRQQNRWAWISGSSTPNKQPEFSNREVPSTDAHPGARTLSSVWVDTDGNTWLFGGNGYGGNVGSNPLNNLWRYNPVTNEWTFMKGEISSGATPVYGTKGVSDPGNTPGGTASPAFWKDNEGSLWLFGGRSREGYLNQIWKLSPSCGETTGAISPATSSICPGGSVVLTASGGSSYEWRLNDVPVPGENDATITATEAGTYSVIIINGRCSGPASNTAVVSQANTPVGSITPDSATICPGGSQVLTATGGTSYQWLLNGNVIEGETSATLTVNAAGTYSVVINQNGCSAPGSSSSYVTMASTQGMRYPGVQVSANTATILTARPNGTAYQWDPATGLDNPSSPTPTVTVNQDVQYLVRIVLEGGCEVVDTVQVSVGVVTTKVFVPTAFTPNRNNANDILRPLPGLASISFFRVYNRWGNKVYETNQVGAGWDGTYNGAPQPSDTYTWVLFGKLPNGEQVKLSGKTLLIR